MQSAGNCKTYLHTRTPIILHDLIRLKILLCVYGMDYISQTNSAENNFVYVIIWCYRYSLWRCALTLFPHIVWKLRRGPVFCSVELLSLHCAPQPQSHNAIHVPFDQKIGACATTTKCLDNKICTFKSLLSWRFPRKQRFWTIFLSAPKPPPPPEKPKFYCYCRLAFSEKRDGTLAYISSSITRQIFSKYKTCCRLAPSLLRGPDLQQ